MLAPVARPGHLGPILAAHPVSSRTAHAVPSGPPVGLFPGQVARGQGGNNKGLPAVVPEPSGLWEGDWSFVVEGSGPQRLALLSGAPHIQLTEGPRARVHGECLPGMLMSTCSCQQAPVLHYHGMHVLSKSVEDNTPQLAPMKAPSEDLCDGLRR